MTDGIGRIGSSNYGLGGSFYRANREVKEEPTPQPQTVKPETNEIDPDKVLDLLNQASSIYMPVVKTENVSVNLPFRFVTTRFSNSTWTAFPRYFSGSVK